MTRRSFPASMRVYLSLFSLTLLLSCLSYVVTGPDEVVLGTGAEYRLDLHPGEPNPGPWTAYLGVEVPEGWTFLSCDYKETSGDPIRGAGTLLDTAPSLCDWDVNPSPEGYTRIYIRSQEHEAVWGSVAANVRFRVDGSVGQFTLAFQMYLNACLYPEYIGVNVLENLIFVDGFESGDTSAWSTVGP